MPIDWQAILTQLGSTAVVVVVLAYAGRKVAELWLAQRLQQHKTALDATAQHTLEQLRHAFSLATERTRSELQRQATSYGHFIAMRHEAYAEVWARLIAAQGRAIDLTRLDDQNFEYYDDNDVVRHLKRRRIPAGERTRIADLWRRSRPEGVAALNKITRASARYEADRAYRKAHNSFVRNQLYLSDETEAAVKLLLVGLEELRAALWSAADLPARRSSAFDSAEAHLVRHKVADALQALQRRMREELAQEDWVMAKAS